MNSITLICISLLLHQVVGPPPRRGGKEVEDVRSEENDSQNNHLQELGLEYNRYLKEVVNALESDPEFRDKLEKAEETDIRTGKIAKELEFVDHKVRTKLDELKRQELERLRHLAQREFELRNGLDVDHLKIPPQHLDHSNPYTFEIEDLKKLIAKTTSDLAEADRRRRQEFKEYEMQKEFEKNEKMKLLDEKGKKEFEKELKDNETKHKRHAPLHHPGSKQQLEEVWEKQDHMENQEFDPKVFFNLHDLDGNGVWDADEVKTLFLKELDKLYQAGVPEDDMKERAEEMERMREHVFSEADTNKDGLISYEEFLAQTKQPEFEKDSGWESLDQQQIYTHEEYMEFERKRQEEIQRMIQQGLIPPQPVYSPPHGYQHHPQFQQQNFPQGHYPQGQQHHQQPLAQGHIPPGQFHPNQIPPGVHPVQQQQHIQPGGQIPQGVHPAQQQHFQQGGQIPPGVHPVQQQQQYSPPSGAVHQDHLNPGQYAQVLPNQLPSQGNQHPAAQGISDQQHHGVQDKPLNDVNNHINQIPQTQQKQQNVAGGKQ